MKLFKPAFLLLFFASAIGQAQELVLLKGKVTSQLKELNQVNILNIRSESTAATDYKGDYSIFVKVGDTLQFSSMQIVTKKVAITETDIAKKLYVTAVEGNVIPLEEVEVKTYPNINAVSLGILQKPAKVYTPAERKLYTAGEFHWYSPLLIPVGGMSVDGLLNAINGRRAQLLKELEVERKEKLLEKIAYLFQEDYFLNQLKIPKDNLRGFWYYAVEDERMVKALNEGNKINIQFIFADLAVKYSEIIKE